MKNETVAPQIYKKKQVFIVKEKNRRKKSKTISSPVNRQRRHTEPILSELARLKRQIRINQESNSLQRNQVPPYPQQMRQRAISIPSTYQQYPMQQPPYPYNPQGQYDPSRNGSINPIYNTCQQQQPSNQPILNNQYAPQGINQNMQGKAMVQNVNNPRQSPPQQNNGMYNGNPQRMVQQTQPVYGNNPSKPIDESYKSYANTSTIPPNSYVQQGNVANAPHTPGQYENKVGFNNSNPINNKNGQFVKQMNSNNSGINSMSSSCTNPIYSNSSQTDCSITHTSSYHDPTTQQPYVSSLPVIQKSNSWVGNQESNNTYVEPPQLYQTQSSVPSYHRNSIEYNKQYNQNGNQYNPAVVRETQQPQYTNYAAYKNGGVVKNNIPSQPPQYFNPYPYANSDNQQIQNTPSTIASRTSQSPRNGENIVSFENGQNLYRSQSENIEQDLQDFFIDSNKHNEQENDDMLNPSTQFKDSDIFMNSHINNNNINDCPFNDDNELPSYLAYPYSSLHNQNYQPAFQGSEYNQYVEYNE